VQQLVLEQALVLEQEQALRLVQELVLQLALVLEQAPQRVQVLRLVQEQQRCASMRARRCSRARLRA
jgi:hypothetical protein